MNNKKKIASNLANEYMRKISQDYNQAFLITASFQDNKDLIEDVYNMSLVSICIKYETFTADLLSQLTDWKIEYNRPWAYTRKGFSLLDIDNDDAYKKAKKAWNFYNAVKHVNKSTHLHDARLKSKLNLQNSKETLSYVYEALSQLLCQFTDDHLNCPALYCLDK